MSETSLPSIESANCISCKDKQRCFALIQISEPDLNDTDGNPAWMCWNCAYEKGMTVERSLEGFLIWCANCDEPIFWDASNRCHECMVPQDPDEGYCDSCWDDTSDDWDGKYDLNGKESKESFAEIHKNCY